MTKLSSYQKLKKKNQELLEDIRVLVGLGNTIAEEMVKTKYRLRYDLENNLMYGCRNLDKYKLPFLGIHNLITEDKESILSKIKKLHKNCKNVFRRRGYETNN